MTDLQQPKDQAAEGKMQLMQRLQKAIPDAGKEELARLLQLEIKHAPQKSDKKEEATLSPSGLEDSRPKQSIPANLSYPPKIKEVPFLYHHGYELKDVSSALTTPPQNYTKAKPFDGAIPSTLGEEIYPELLTPWQKIWPVLHSIFSEDKKTKRLDENKIIKKAIKQQPLKKIPWQKKTFWPQQIVLVADFSPHLAPYFKDYFAVAKKMQDWFKDRLHLVICTDSEDQSFIYRDQRYDEFPIQGENLYILYLGDLGFLDRQGIRSARYYFLGQTLFRRNARIEALLTVNPRDFDPSLSRYYNFYHWDSTLITPARAIQTKTHVSLQQTKDLLSALSLAFEVTPAMVRRMRIHLGFTVSVEGLVFQEGALQGNILSYQWASEEIRKTYNDKLDELVVSQDGRDELWEIIEVFESRLPIELQIEQRHKIGRPLIKEQKDFLWNLVKSSNQETLNESEEMVFGWIERMAARSGKEIWQDGVAELYYCYWKKKQPKCIPDGIDLTKMPEYIGEPEDYQAVSIRLEQGKLFFSTKGKTQNTISEFPVFMAKSTSEIVVISSGCNEIKKETLPLNGVITLPDDLNKIIIHTGKESHETRAMICPPWASAIGRDRYGLFTEITVKDVRFVMRWMPPGNFMMGSPEDEPERYSDEGPQHSVKIKEGFWLAETACTQELWTAVMGNNPSRFKDDLQNPVERVDREEILVFMETINSFVPDLSVLLPSEAQWEYGCRAGTTTPFWFGDQLSVEKANYDGEEPYNDGLKGESRGKTVPVKSFERNPWGLYQMHGNVWELCQDFWHDSYDGAPDDGRVWEGGDKRIFVYRGGSWISDGRNLRSACRRHWLIANVHYGFRLALGPGKHVM